LCNRPLYSYGTRSTSECNVKCSISLSWWQDFHFPALLLPFTSLKVNSLNVNSLNFNSSNFNSFNFNSFFYVTGLCIATVHVQQSPDLASHLRIHSVPEVMGMVNGRLTHFKMDMVSLHSLREFVRNLFPKDTLMPVSLRSLMPVSLRSKLLILQCSLLRHACIVNIVLSKSKQVIWQAWGCSVLIKYHCLLLLLVFK
jgi:hypothetical protein